MTEKELRRYVKLIKKQNDCLLSTIDRKEKMEQMQSQIKDLGKISEDTEQEDEKFLQEYR